MSSPSSTDGGAALAGRGPGNTAPGPETDPAATAAPAAGFGPGAGFASGDRPPGPETGPAKPTNPADPIAPDAPTRPVPTLRIGTVELPNPFILAPMAGLTSWPYRRLCLAQGAGLAVTEMASATALAHHGRQTLKLLASDRSLERILCVQLFGKDPGVMAEAARVCRGEAGADLIDLNFGCPARKVVSSGHGGALLRDPELCRRIVSAAASAVDVPVTVKLRPGFLRADGPIVLDLGPALASHGAAALTLHPRYVSDRFEGLADWSLIARLAAAAAVPVIGSGDLRTPEEAAGALAGSGAAGVMIGRASRGRPWIFRQALEFWRTGAWRPATMAERLETALLHARLLEAEIGPKAAFRLRTILMWYTRELPGAAALRAAICREDRVERQLELLAAAMGAEEPVVRT
jgi:nifR3 family TIM-barrel protein